MKMDQSLVKEPSLGLPTTTLIIMSLSASIKILTVLFTVTTQFKSGELLSGIGSQMVFFQEWDSRF